MDASQRKPCSAQRLMQRPCHVPAFEGRSELSAEDQIVVRPFWPCCQSHFQLLSALCCEQLFHFRRKRDHPASCSGFRRTGFQESLALGVVAEVSVPADGLCDGEVVVLDVRPAQACQFRCAKTCSQDEIQGASRSVVSQGGNESPLLFKSQELDLLALQSGQDRALCRILNQHAIDDGLFQRAVQQSLRLADRRRSLIVCKRSRDNNSEELCKRNESSFTTTLGLFPQIYLIW